MELTFKVRRENDKNLRGIFLNGIGWDKDQGICWESAYRQQNHSFSYLPPIYFLYLLFLPQFSDKNHIIVFQMSRCPAWVLRDNSRGPGKQRKDIMIIHQC